MAELLIPDVEEALLDRLRERASKHGRTPDVEAKTILLEVLQLNPWAIVDAIRERLAATGRNFGDSTELIREDRER